MFITRMQYNYLVQHYPYWMVQYWTLWSINGATINEHVEEVKERLLS